MGHVDRQQGEGGEVELRPVWVIVGDIEQVEEEKSMPGQGTEVEVELEKRLEHPHQVDGSETLERVGVTGTERDHGGEVIGGEVITLHRAQVFEHRTAVEGQVG